MSAAQFGHILGNLKGVRKVGDGYQALCPAHDDHVPSLSVGEGDDGRPLVVCHAGCDTAAVLAAAGLDWSALFPTSPKGDGKREIIATYDYLDEAGELLFQVVRYDPKDFRQRRPDGNGGWAWKLHGVRRVLYRLPAVIETARAGGTIYVVEGEADVHAIEGAGGVASCNPGGAGKWRDEYATYLKGFDEAVVVADKDVPGHKHAADVAASAAKVIGRVRTVEAAEGKDARDHLAAGRGLDEFVDIDLGDATDGDLGLDPGVGADASTSTSDEKKSVATVLVDLAESLYRFGVSTDGDVFAVPRQGAQLVTMLRGGRPSLRAELSRAYFDRTGKAASQQALADALLVLEGRALHAEPEVLHLRVADHDGAWWLDMGDATGRAVCIDGAGWRIDEPPVWFRRTALTLALTDPVPGGDLDLLWPFLNLEADDRPLIVAWLVADLMETIPHPVLALFGEQGSAKTFTMGILTSLLDPSPVPARKPPRDADSWVTAAAGSWIVGLDNLSNVTDWLSDSLCRAVTGDGDVRRRLYTDGDLFVFAFRRCVVLTAIDLGALRGDLAERLLPIELPRFGDGERRDENALWAAWERAHPKVLGGLLDVAVRVAAVLPSVTLERSPRMVDFAKVVAAVDAVLGTHGFDAFMAKQGTLATDSLEGDEFIAAIAHAGPFRGTSAQLLARVRPPDDGWRTAKQWPQNARAVTQRLNRQAPVMRKAGWIVDHDGGANKGHALVWTIRPPEKPGIPPSPGSPPGEEASQASQASIKSGPFTADGQLFAAASANVQWPVPAPIPTDEEARPYARVRGDREVGEL